MEQLIQHVKDIIILIAIFVTWHFQKRKIDGLQSLVNSQKGILDAVNSYFSIFKIDEVKKYAALREESAKMEADKKVRESVSKMDAVLMKHSEKYSETIGQLLYFTWGLLIKLPPKLRQQYVDELLKGQAKEMIAPKLQEFDAIYLPPPMTLFDVMMSGLQAPQTGGSLQQDSKSYHRDDKLGDGG